MLSGKGVLPQKKRARTVAGSPRPVKSGVSVARC